MGNNKLKTTLKKIKDIKNIVNGSKKPKIKYKKKGYIAPFKEPTMAELIYKQNQDKKRLGERRRMFISGKTKLKKIPKLKGLFANSFRPNFRILGSAEQRYKSFLENYLFQHRRDKSIFKTVKFKKNNKQITITEAEYDKDYFKILFFCSDINTYFFLVATRKYDYKNVPSSVVSLTTFNAENVQDDGDIDPKFAKRLL